MVLCYKRKGLPTFGKSLFYLIFRLILIPNCYSLRFFMETTPLWELMRKNGVVSVSLKCLYVVFLYVLGGVFHDVFSSLGKELPQFTDSLFVILVSVISAD